MQRKTKTPEVLAKNPNSQTPLLEFEDGKLLTESNPILIYLAEANNNFLLPSAESSGAATTAAARTDPSSDEDNTITYSRGLTYQWLFFEQCSHKPAIAVRRANLKFDRPRIEETMAQFLEKGEKALNVMEQQLMKIKYLVGASFTIADVALFAYTHVADQGGHDLTKFPKICAWLRRIKSRDDYVGMSILEKTSINAAIVA